MRNFFKFSLLTSILLSVLFLFGPTFVHAQDFSGGSNNSYGAPISGGTNNQISLVSPLEIKSICGLLKAFLNILLTLGIPIVVLFLVYSGFLFVKARGNPKELMRANKNFRYVILGIFLFLGAWMLGQIVASTINTLGAGSNAPGVGSCQN